MQTHTIRRGVYDRTDVRLGRNLNHDSRNRAYPFRASASSLISVRHERFVPVFNQGTIGSCTADAGLGCLGTGPFYATVQGKVAFDQPTIEAVYHEETVADGFPGVWKPDDTGSDGPTCGKVLTTRKLISGYQHAFTVNDMLAALQVKPVIIGINWYEGMFSPAADGLVTISGAVAGGHEICVDSYDAATGRIGLTNSWGTGWGVGGRFFMDPATYTRLLGEDGDVTIFVPTTQGPPTPVPVPPADADAALVKAGNSWEKTVVSRTTQAGKMKTAFDKWKAAKGY